MWIKTQNEQKFETNIRKILVDNLIKSGQFFVKKTKRSIKKANLSTNNAKLRKMAKVIHNYFRYAKGDK